MKMRSWSRKAEAHCPTLRHESLAPATGTVALPVDPAWHRRLRQGPIRAERRAGEASSDSGDDTAVILDTLSGAALAVSPASLVNECSRAASEWIWCDDFDIDRLARYFEFAKAGGRFTRAARTWATVAPTRMRAVYATTPQTSSGALHLAFGKTPQPYFRPVDAGTAKYRELYWRIFVRYPTSWQGGGADKLSRATSFVSS